MTATAESGRNRRLRPKRARAEVENSTYHDVVVRMLRAYGRRVARSGNVEDLGTLLSLHAVIDEAADTAVEGLRAEPRAASWTDLGAAVPTPDGRGITRQAAAKRWRSTSGVRIPGGQPAHLR